jgi:glycopeptide antibiotics resistance protein
VLTGVVVYPFSAALAALVAWRAARSGQPAFVAAARVLLVLYLGWVACATLFPIPVRPGFAELEAAGRQVEVGLVPLASIRDVLVNGSPFAQVWILGGNVLTLAPFGFLLPFTAPRLATWRRMALAALLFPLGIELAQLSLSLTLGYSYRVTEIDDVLLNAAGVLLGFAAYVAARGIVASPLPKTPTRGDPESTLAPWTGRPSS